MHNIVLIYHYGASQTLLYDEKEEAAQADYGKLKAALEDWKRFKNDTKETIEIDGSGMGKITIRLEHLMSASVVNYGEDEKAQADWSAYIGRLKRAEKAAEDGHPNLIAPRDPT